MRFDDLTQYLCGPLRNQLYDSFSDPLFSPSVRTQTVFLLRQDETAATRAAEAGWWILEAPRNSLPLSALIWREGTNRRCRTEEETGGAKESTGQIGERRVA